MIRACLVSIVVVSLCLVSVRIVLAQDSPRVTCLVKCKTNLSVCLASAGSDEKKKSACNKELQTCISLCPASPLPR
jgi:hypothetical protein